VTIHSKGPDLKKFEVCTESSGMLKVRLNTVFRYVPMDMLLLKAETLAFINAQEKSVVTLIRGLISTPTLS